MVKWPFQRLSDLQLGDHKVTLNRLVYNFSSPPFKKDLPNTNHEQKPSFPLYWLFKNGILLMAYYNPQITWIVCCIIPYVYPINNKFLSLLTLLPGWHPNRLMEPKYLSFRRWPRTPIILWQGDWIPAPYNDNMQKIRHFGTPPPSVLSQHSPSLLPTKLSALNLGSQLLPRAGGTRSAPTSGIARVTHL